MLPYIVDTMYVPLFRGSLRAVHVRVLSLTWTSHRGRCVYQLHSWSTIMQMFALRYSAVQLNSDRLFKIAYLTSVLSEGRLRVGVSAICFWQL